MLLLGAVCSQRRHWRSKSIRSSQLRLLLPILPSAVKEVQLRL